MINYKLNEFFQNILLKKQYINKLKNKIIDFNNIKKHKNTHNLVETNFVQKEDYLVKYIIDVTYSRANTLLTVTDFLGTLKFFCSAGNLQYGGKKKKIRRLVFRDFYKILVSKLKFLRNQPIALHLKNVDSDKFWVLKRLKKKFFIKIVKTYSTYPYNGCRKKKIRRKKFRTNKKKALKRKI